MRILLTLLCLLPVAWTSLLRAQLASNFTVVIDSTAPGFPSFGAYPTINDSGAVAFYAEPTLGVGKIFKTDGVAAPVFIANDGTGAPCINNAGEVSSRRWIGFDVELYKATSADNLTTVARTASENGTFRTFLSTTPSLNDNGTAVFFAELNPYTPRRRGIYAGSGGSTTSVVADNTGVFTYFGDAPMLNNAGAVVFTASLATTEEGLFVGSVGGNNAASTVVKNTTAPLYKFDGSPAINNLGQIAFLANENATGANAIFVINRNGTGLQKIAGSEGPFSAFRAPVINDLGTVAFLAFLDSGIHGIFIGPDPVTDRVIATGDSLFGSTVTGLGFFRGLNENNDLVFYYRLADERTGIARVKVDPSQGARTTFAHWQRAYFTAVQLEDSAVSGPSADPAGTGAPNLLKYAFNSAPTQAPVASQTSAGVDANYVSLTYTKLSGAADLTYTVEQSSNLMQWTPVTPTNEVTDDGTTQRITARVPKGGANDRSFLRLRVSR